MKLDISRLTNVKRQSDGSIQCQCPICASEENDKTSRNHLRIYPSGAFSCIIDNTKDHNRRIAAYLRNTSPEDNPDIVFIDPEPKLKIEKIYPEDSLNRLLPNYEYWVNRGARPDVIAKLEGGLAPSDERSKLWGRFVFPVRGLDGRIIGWTGRLITNNSFAPKWKHICPIKKIVYPWNIASPHIKESKTCILLESVGDLIALASHDIWNTLCIFGLNLNGKVISTLISAGTECIIVSLNRDEDESKGQRAAEQIRNKLCAFFQEDHIHIILPPVGVKDWGEATKEHIDGFKKEVKSCQNHVE